MNRQTFDWAFREFVGYLFRPRGFEGPVVAACATVLVALLGWDWYVKAQGPDDYSLEVSSANALPPALQWTLIVIFTAMIIFCIFVGWKRFMRDHEMRNRKKVVVIEGRGLREDDGSPLTEAVPVEIVGHRIGVLLDLRQRKDGLVVDPEELLLEVDSVRRNVQQYASRLGVHFMKAKKDLESAAVPVAITTDAVSATFYRWEDIRAAWPRFAKLGIAFAFNRKVYTSLPTAIHR